MRSDLGVPSGRRRRKRVIPEEYAGLVRAEVDP